MPDSGEGPRQPAGQEAPNAAEAVSETEPPYALIREGLQSGRVIPFLGAGVSLGSRQEGERWTSPTSNFPPSAAELATYLDRLSGYPSGEPAELTRVAQYFAGVAGPGGLDDQLHKVFAREYSPAQIHRYLADLPNPLIVTTNYDNLLERAFLEKQRPFRVVIYRTGSPTFLFWDNGAASPTEIHANQLDFAIGDSPVIYKMHGACDSRDPERDSYVITEDDYVEFLARMTSQTALPAIFAEPFRKSYFLFLGYSLRDWNLRVVLHKIWQAWPRKRYASWAIQQRADRLEREFWSKRLLTIFEMTIDQFLANLRRS